MVTLAASMVLISLEIGHSRPPSRSILMKTLQIFREKKDGGSAWYKSLPKGELSPRDRRLQSSSFQVFMKIPMRRRSNKRPLSFQIWMFFFLQDERTCNFCWTDSATDWGELTKKRFPWCTTIAQCSMKYSTTTCTLQKFFLAAMNLEKGLWMISIDTEKGFACVLASADNSFQ